MSNRSASSHLDPTRYNITWLEQFLRRTRRRHRLLSSLQATLNATLALFCWGSLLALVQWGYPSLKFLHFFWLGGVGVAVGYWVWSWIRLSRQLAKLPVAEKVEEWNPEATGFLTALELGRALPSLQDKPFYSASLSQARIDQVASAMRALHPLDIVPFQEFRWRAYVFFSVAMLFFALLAFFPRPVSDALGALFYAPSAQKANPLLQSDHNALVVGDLSITYQYPDYTGRSPRTIPNSDGSLNALKGTKVIFRARSLFSIKRAAIHLNNRTFLRFQVGEDKRSISGQVDLLKPGFYRFVLITDDETIHRGPTHPIQVQEDENPTVKLLSPTENIELQSSKSLEMQYKFSDDFGISKIYLVYRNTSAKRMKQAERVLLREFQSPPRGGEGEYNWDLQALPFSPGDTIAYFIEVQDNDIISGPKKSQSETRTVKIFSPLKQHDKLLDQQEKLLAKMTSFLADLIEIPDPQKNTIPTIERTFRTLNRTGEHLIGDFDKLIPLMREDAMTRPYSLIVIENLHYRLKDRQLQRIEQTKRLGELRQYRPFLRRHAEQARAQEIPPQEDDVYAFRLLLDSQHLDILRKLAKKLTAAQNKLNDLLEQYKQKRDEESKRALMRQMDLIEKLITEIQRRRAKLRKLFPEGYFRLKPLRKKREAISQIDKMRKMIKSGDIENAAKELSKLARQIERMASEVEQETESGGRESPMLNTMRKMIDDLQQLEQKQRRLADNTQAVRQQILKRMQKALKSKLDQLVKKQLERNKQIEQDLKNIQDRLGADLHRYRYKDHIDAVQQRNNELRSMLKQKDIFEALQGIEQLQNQANRFQSSLELLDRFSMRWQNNRWQQPTRSEKFKKVNGHMQRIVKNIDEMQRDLEKFFPSPQPYMNQKDRQMLQRYQQYQETLQDNARQIQQKMQRIASRMPMFKPEMQQKLGEAAQQMQDAAQRLGQRAPKPAYIHQQNAIKKLQELHQSMQQSIQPQQDPSGSGKRRGRRGRGGKKKGNKGQRGGQGMRGFQRSPRDVKIPKPGEHKAPKALRQDILDAMKEKLPHRYREPVRKYYEKLVQ